MATCPSSVFFAPAARTVWDFDTVIPDLRCFGSQRLTAYRRKAGVWRGLGKVCGSLSCIGLGICSILGWSLGGGWPWVAIHHSRVEKLPCWLPVRPGFGGCVPTGSPRPAAGTRLWGWLKQNGFLMAVATSQEAGFKPGLLHSFAFRPTSTWRRHGGSADRRTY